MKHTFCISFFLFCSTQLFSQSRYSGHEKPVIADYVPNIPEELIESGKLSKYVTLSLPGDDRWNPDNDMLNANGVVYAIGQNRDEFLSCYIGGHFDSIGGIPAKGLAFFDDHIGAKSFTEVGGGIQGGDVYAIIPIQNTNELYVAGNFTKADTIDVHGIAHWTGAAWEDLGGGTDSTILALIFVGNQLYAGGNFRHAGGQEANYIAVWDTTLKIWSPVMDGVINGVNGGVSSMELTGTGGLYIGGGFTKVGSVAANKIAILNGKWSSLLTGITGINSAVYAVKAVNGSGILVGGDFSTVGILPAGNIALWSQNSWQNNLGIQFTEGFDKPVQVIGNISERDIYIGGDFRKAGDSTANFIAKFQNNFLPLGSGLDGPCYALAGVFLFVSLQSFPNHVYVGGKFNNAGLKQSQNFAIWGELGGGSVKENNQHIESISISPNPAQTSATIKFSLLQRANISISIIDPLGRIIKSFNSGWRESGVQEIQLDTKNFPNGAYYFFLQIDGQSVAVPFVVIR
jgi:hypothetical protein